MMFITPFELGYFSNRVPNAMEPVDAVPYLAPTPNAPHRRRFGRRTKASAGLG